MASNIPPFTSEWGRPDRLGLVQIIADRILDPGLTPMQKDFFNRALPNAAYYVIEPSRPYGTTGPVVVE